MKLNRYFWMACLAGTGCGACTGDEKVPTIEEILAIEKGRIHAFLEGKACTVLPHEYTATGGQARRDTLYVLNNDTTGRRPVDGEFVLIDYDEMAFNGTYIASTDPARFVGEGLAAPYPLGGPVYMPVSLPGDPFSRALHAMSEGTTGEMILPSTLAGRYAGNYFYARFRVWRVIPDVHAYERGMIEAYVADLEARGEVAGEDIFTENTATGDTTIVAITRRGEGEEPFISTGARVKCSYTLYLLNEPALATPASFLKRKVESVTDENALFLDLTGTIAGFRQGMTRLRKGDEAILVIPFGMAYGQQGDVERMIIPPYATLVFKVKVIDVE
jgi:hypothetical protein